jgi:hypothetical protein
MLVSGLGLDRCQSGGQCTCSAVVHPVCVFVGLCEISVTLLPHGDFILELQGCA